MPPNNTPAVREGTSLADWNPDELRVIRETLLPPGSDDNDLAVFALYCRQTGLSPFARQIYAIKDPGYQGRPGKLTVQATIDGVRLVSERSGKLRGVVGPEWCGPDGEWKQVWLDDSHPPAAARFGVYVDGDTNGQPRWGVATWREFAKRNRDGSYSRAWNNMGAHMLGKVAESMARRSAFPAELSGVYGEGEVMDAAPTYVVVEDETEEQAKLRGLYEAQEAAQEPQEATEVAEGAAEPSRGPESAQAPSAPVQLTPEQQAVRDEITAGMTQEQIDALIEKMKGAGIVGWGSLVVDPVMLEIARGFRHEIMGTGTVLEEPKPEPKPEAPKPAAKRKGITPRQIAKLHTASRRAGVDRVELREIIAEVVGSGEGSANDLTNETLDVVLTELGLIEEELKGMPEQQPEDKLREDIREAFDATEQPPAEGADGEQ